MQCLLEVAVTRPEALVKECSTFFDQRLCQCCYTGAKRLKGFQCRRLKLVNNKLVK